MSTSLQFGIASDDRPGDVEPLGLVSRRFADAVVADSAKQWPGVYLVVRRGGRWDRATNRD